MTFLENNNDFFVDVEDVEQASFDNFMNKADVIEVMEQSAYLEIMHSED